MITVTLIVKRNLQALKDLDYEIREKTFVEKLLGIEYSDPSDKGVFFIGKNRNESCFMGDGKTST